MTTTRLTWFGRQRAKHVATCIAIIALWTLAFPPGAIGQEPLALPSVSPRAQEIEAVFADLDNSESMAVSVAVIKDNSVVHRFHRGWADVGANIPIDDRSVFNTGSVSKQFTVFGILLLRDDGKLSLSDDIRKFIPELPDYGTPITLEQLARHTSGLRSPNHVSYIGGWTQTDQFEHNQMMDLIRRQQTLPFEPGSQFQYSNAGAALLSEVIARVSGKPFQVFMKERVYEPLGMDSTFNRGEAALVIPNEAHSYYPEDGQIKKAINANGVQGYTNVYSTTHDLALWIDNFKTHHVGSERSINELLSPTVLPSGRVTEHRMGLYATPYRGYLQYQHTGSHRGYVSYIGWFPEHDLTIIVLSSVEGIELFPAVYAIADLFLPETDGPLTLDQMPNAAPTVLLDDETLSSYIGQYMNLEADLVRTIDLRDDQLHYVRGAENASPLRPIGSGSFQMMDAWSEVFVHFRDGSMIFEDSGGEFVLERYDTPVANAPLEELTAISGLYASDEANALYRVSICDNAPVLTNAKMDVVFTTRVKPDVYRSNAWYLRSIRFTRDRDNRVDGFLAGNVGVTGVKFVKVPETAATTPRYPVCRQLKPRAKG